MNVGLYVRVSTDEQAKDGHSIHAQISKLKAFATFNDWEGTTYVDDGYSAKDLKRPEINALFKDIKSGKINAVAIHKLDRLTRSVKNLHEILEIFDKYNCKLISITESLDTSSAGGRFFITMLGAMAQWERETISERTSIGVKQAITSGKVSGRVPLGYIKQGDGFIIDEANATIVKRIFEKYNQGTGSTGIVKDFQREGLIPYDQPWDHTKIIRILINRVYVGEFISKFSDGETHINYDAYPAIIDKELFEAVQLLLKKRKGLHPRQKMKKRLFSGIGVCALCGAPIHCNSNRDIRYQCKNRKALISCSAPTFVESEFEKAFVEYISKILTDLNLDDLGEVRNKINNGKLKMQKELDKIKNIKLKNHAAFENDLISLDVYKTRIQELNIKEKELTDLLGQEQELPRIFSMQIQNFESLWNSLEYDDKRVLILKSIKKVHVRKEAFTRKQGILHVEDIEFS